MSSRRYRLRHVCRCAEFTLHFRWRAAVLAIRGCRFAGAEAREMLALSFTLLYATAATQSAQCLGSPTAPTATSVAFAGDRLSLAARPMRRQAVADRSQARPLSLAFHAIAILRLARCDAADAPERLLPCYLSPPRATDARQAREGGICRELADCCRSAAAAAGCRTLPPQCRRVAPVALVISTLRAGSLHQAAIIRPCHSQTPAALAEAD